MTSPIKREDNCTCEECGRTYWVKPYRVTKSRFCSFGCGGRHRARVSLNTGSKPWAKGNKWRAGKRPSNAFTPKQVRGKANPRWVEGIALTCRHCGGDFKQKPWLAKQNGVAKFCSRECFQASGCFVGEASSSYVGGPTTYRGRGWTEARAAVVAEQGGRCAHCEKYVGRSLPVHHRTPFREFATAEEANVRTNLIGLCQSCHMKEERATNDLFISPRAPEPVQQPLFGVEAA